MDSFSALQKVRDYFNSRESRLGYSFFLKGRKHFGYYPEGKNGVSIGEAQDLMEDKLFEALGLPSDSLVLDAGCGEGGVSLNLASGHGFRAEGVDLLDWAVGIAKRKAGGMNLSNRVHFQVMDYTKLSFPDETFSGVFTMETLVHVPDHREALRQFLRVLKPGGRLALFEYSHDFDALRKSNIVRAARIAVEKGSMHSLPFFKHGGFPEILEGVGFSDVFVEDITPRVVPLLLRMRAVSFFPYWLVRLLGWEWRFVNTVSAYWGLEMVRTGAWKYNIVRARKPGGGDANA